MGNGFPRIQAIDADMQKQQGFMQAFNGQTEHSLFATAAGRGGHKLYSFIVWLALRWRVIVKESIAMKKLFLSGLLVTAVFISSGSGSVAGG